MFVSIFDDLPPEQQNSEFLGGKGHGLFWMQSRGINVPPAIVFPTTMCVEYMKNPQAVKTQVQKLIPKIYQFFMPECEDKIPLLSVRSGARASMPGMMDTILNVGLDASTFDTWADRLGEQCASDSYKRLVCMYGSVAKNLPRHKLEDQPTVELALSKYERLAGEPFPGADDQLLNSIIAVFESWNNERAKIYRKMNNIPDDWGTAVVVQAMVFGNLDDQSGTGVLFTRNPDTGEDVVTGEFLINAQGEDVVAGTRTPMPLSKMSEWNAEVAQQLLTTVEKLESEKLDAQDVEFTIQGGKLYILQTRTAKRSALAAVKIAWDMYSEKLITREQALTRVSPADLDMAERPVVSPKFKDAPLCEGFAASSGVAIGKPVFSKEEAVASAEAGVKCILITKETTPDDLQGMIAAQGVMTMEGGSTSHAAVVARGMNKPCVTAVGRDPKWFAQFSIISFCGSTGRIWNGEATTVGGKSEVVGKFRNLIIGEGSLVVRQVPEFKVERLVLDLSASLLESDQAIKDKVIKARSLCNQLQVTVTVSDEAQTFYTAEQLVARLMQVRDLVDSLPKAGGLSVLGWDSKSHGSTVVVSDIEELINAKTGGICTLETLAAMKVMGWLKAEGKNFTIFGKTGVAKWSAHVG